MTTLDWILSDSWLSTALGGLATRARGDALLASPGSSPGRSSGRASRRSSSPDGIESSYTGLVGIGGALVGAALLCALARFVGSFVRGGLRLLPPLRLLDSLGGAVRRRRASGFTLVWVGGAVAMQITDQPEVRQEVRQSQVLQRLNRIAPPKELLNIDARQAATAQPQPHRLRRALAEQLEHGRRLAVRRDDVDALAAPARRVDQLARVRHPDLGGVRRPRRSSASWSSCGTTIPGTSLCRRSASR